MTHDDQVRIDRIARQYRRAVTPDDWDTQDQIWDAAGHDAVLTARLQRVHREIVAEQEPRRPN